ncbi:hypothetical protein [Sorangium sp. So ce1078]|uniref:hypothetical protein n=1 Tax=Sorangium sp. So ce1078 TaxID=3133329 RepID=UPI003F622713
MAPPSDPVACTALELAAALRRRESGARRPPPRRGGPLSHRPTGVRIEVDGEPLPYEIASGSWSIPTSLA